jgi:hypothetical protein
MLNGGSPVSDDAVKTTGLPTRLYWVCDPGKLTRPDQQTNLACA